MDYKQIIAAAAERKLIDMYKFFLDILEEIKKDQEEGVDNFREALKQCQSIEEIEPFLIFLGMSENKKQIIRKRILDRANDLIRELKS